MIAVCSTKLQNVSSGVPQGNVLEPVLYTLYTHDLPQLDFTYTATCADDTVVLSSYEDKSTASYYLQQNLREIELWLKKLRIKANESKSVQVTFTLKKGKCPEVLLNSKTLPQATDVKYLGLHLDQRLTWQKHILMKRNQLSLKLRELYWLIDKSSKMSLDCKLLIYKSIIKPVWTHGIQLWGVAAKSKDFKTRFYES